MSMLGFTYPHVATPREEHRQIVMATAASKLRPVHLAYQPPASSDFLSEQTSH
jgi:hypothetical protein